MTNKDFYAYCRDQRKIEPDASKREALADVYDFMWECSVSKRGVSNLISTRIYQIQQKEQHYRARSEEENQAQIAAYQWLLAVFEGKEPPQPVAQNGSTLWQAE